jgi:quinol monooxygenase YgiN
MARKLLDCRQMPSESGCTLTLAGEEDEVIRAGAAHAVDVHGHVDNAELRDGLRAGLRDADAEPNTEAGAFLQVIEFKTRRFDDLIALQQQWAKAIGADRTTRWDIRTADRDEPDTYVVIVEFPDHRSAMANSEHPATADFATQLAKLSDEAPKFRNLDVLSTGI